MSSSPTIASWSSYSTVYHGRRAVRGVQPSGRGGEQPLDRSLEAHRVAVGDIDLQPHDASSVDSQITAILNNAGRNDLTAGSADTDNRADLGDGITLLALDCLGCHDLIHDITRAARQQWAPGAGRAACRMLPQADHSTTGKRAPCSSPDRLHPQHLQLMLREIEILMGDRVSPNVKLLQPRRPPWGTSV